MSRQCYCGHVEDEHGGIPEFPGSTECTVEGCDCIGFDHDEEADEDEDET